MRLENYKDTLALGEYDITPHLVMYFLKPIEQGLDVKFTGGIHTGCLRIQAAANSDIHSVEDLRGKRIGVPGMGSPPFVYSNRVLKRHGIDGVERLNGRYFPSANWAWRSTREKWMQSPTPSQSAACC